MTFAINMDRDQAHLNVGPDLRFILFENMYQFLLRTVCFAWNYFNSEDIEICKFYKLSQNFWRALYVSGFQRFYSAGGFK